MKQENCNEGRLLARVRELLKTTELTGLEIYKATGIAPNQQWSIRHGRTPNPSVNAIERLYNLLSGKTLEV